MYQELLQNDNYYLRSEVSNSDLSWLKNQLYPRDMPDPTEAYKFGSLIDAMLTENDFIDYFDRTLKGIQYKKEDFELAYKMKRSFLKDDVCRKLLEEATGQKEMSKRRGMEFNGVPFDLMVRCKWDLWFENSGWGADIKSTTATTQQQFEQAAMYFDYDRQRAWYMDIAGSDKDLLIGISKKNQKIFKIPITRDSDWYKSGRDKYLELAFRWNILFGETKII